jgi:hypothetical protein
MGYPWSCSLSAGDAVLCFDIPPRRVDLALARGSEDPIKCQECLGDMVMMLADGGARIGSNIVRRRKDPKLLIIPGPSIGTDSNFLWELTLKSTILLLTNPSNPVKRRFAKGQFPLRHHPLS